MNESLMRFYIDYRTLPAILSCIMFALSVPFRILGYAEHFDKPFFVITQVVLPSLCAVLMIVSIIFFGKDRLWISVFPLTLGVLSFFFKLFIDPRYTGMLHHVAAGLLYAVIVALWLLTVLYVIKTKWILVGLFTIPLLIHIFGEDLPVILGKAAPLSSSMWLKEASILSIMLALIFCAISFKTN